MTESLHYSGTDFHKSKQKVRDKHTKHTGTRRIKGDRVKTARHASFYFIKRQLLARQTELSGFSDSAYMCRVFKKKAV